MIIYDKESDFKERKYKVKRAQNNLDKSKKDDFE